MSMSNSEKRVKGIRRNTRRKFSTEEKIRIVLSGLRDESSIAELYGKASINQNRDYRWSKDFLEAGKNGCLAAPLERRTPLMCLALRARIRT
jgi:transposase-like protein